MTNYEKRVRALEAEGLTRSDAQGVVDAEDMQSCKHGALKEKYEVLARKLDLVLADNARLKAQRDALIKWCHEELEREEGPGETDRPQYIELRDLLDGMT